MQRKNGKAKLVILISGRGSNMRAIIEASQKQDFPASISAVISNNPEAPGLEFAKNNGIKAITINHKSYESKTDFEAALSKEIKPLNPDLICLAGFMRLLSPDFVNQWPGRILNIHPSLLPKYKGLNTYERAIKAGDKESGCTVHFVVPEMDSGPVILQKKVPIYSEDTPDMLAQRILEQEHKAYPEAIKQVLNSLNYQIAD